MPTVREEAEIDVRAPAAVAFGIVTGDLMQVNDDPEAVAGNRPIDAGPLRSGFRWQQTLAHERRVCRTDWTITNLHEARLLEQSFTHLCAVSGRVLDGGERWEFLQGEDGSTRVRLSAWRERPGLDGWLERIFGSRGWSVSLRRRLNNIQFRAERA
ncbi:MAG TPA: hypothetical protein VJT68_07085 [Thermoleophilaceae bacterium]|nr:hypothetical protein [Thermoleophilaceae bacterium]